MIVAELLRQNKEKSPALTKERVLQASNASQAIANVSKNASNALLGGITCRVKVIGSMRQDLNGRHGTIRYWDAGTFCVGLDTKRSHDSNVQSLMPENLEALSSLRASKANNYSVEINHIFDEEDGGIGCHFMLEKSSVDALRSYDSINAGLQAFCLERNEMEERLRLQLEEERREEEEYRKQEEIDRKRRAARRAKEQAKEEEAREKWRREMEEARRVDFERRNEREEAARMKYERRNAHFDNLRESLHRIFSHKMRLKLSFLKAAANGIPPEDFREYLEDNGIDFEDFDSDDESFFDSYSDFFEEMDDDYDEHVREESEEQDRISAEILGEN